MAKIRCGFVSNSSSSSFIIRDSDNEVNLDELKDKIAQYIYEDYQNNIVNNDWYIKYFKNNPEWEQHYKDNYGNIENIKQMFEVKKYKDCECKFFLQDHMDVNLKDTDVVISDNDDNYFSENVKEFIEDNFDVCDSCWHMG